MLYGLDFFHSALDKSVQKDLYEVKKKKNVVDQKIL